MLKIFEFWSVFFNQNVKYSRDLFELKKRIQSSLDLVRKIFDPFKKIFKIDFDIVRTSILCEFFSAPSIHYIEVRL
jgi:hypothetical protein